MMEKTATMTASEAIACIALRLATCSPEQAQDVSDIVRLGAGLFDLEEGCVMVEPSGLIPKRRVAYTVLADTIRIDTVGVYHNYNPDAPWHPIHSGAWESVLVTLIIEGDWERITETAAELRREEETRQ
jgi:hypothetical protein